MGILKTVHVAINVVDAEKSIPFWRDIMGLKMIADFEMEGKFLDTVQAKENMRYRIVKFVSPDNFMLEVLESKNHIMPAAAKTVLQDTGLRHFAFEVDDVDAMYKHVKKCGCETVSEPSTCEDGSMRLFFVRDPEENLIEIMQFYDV
ncbi:MAG: VOC family protein [Clostridia bacterium]|nr:VOC family protein [Clostridia bacterium]